jgi:hypothetical protein
LASVLLLSGVAILLVGIVLHLKEIGLDPGGGVLACGACVVLTGLFFGFFWLVGGAVGGVGRVVAETWDLPQGPATMTRGVYSLAWQRPECPLFGVNRKSF